MPTQGHAARSYTLPTLNVTGHDSGLTLIRYNTPPWLVTRTHIHDLVTHWEEDIRTQRLGEEIRQVVHSANERASNLVVFDQLTNKEVTTLDVFHTSVVLRVISHINRRLVVHEQVGGIRSAETKFACERGQVHCFLSRFRSGDNFSFARRESNTLLLA